MILRYVVPVLTSVAMQLGSSATAYGQDTANPVACLSGYEIIGGVTITCPIEFEFTGARVRDFDGTSAKEYAISFKSGVDIQWYDRLQAVGVLDIAIDDSSSFIAIDEFYFRAAAWENVKLSAKGGVYTSPFGAFDSLNLSDPLTAAAFEVKGEVLEMVYGDEEAYAEGTGNQLVAKLFASRGRRDIVLHQRRGIRDPQQHQRWRLGAGLSHLMKVGDDTIFRTELYWTHSIYSAPDLIELVPGREPVSGGSLKLSLTHLKHTISGQYVTAFDDIALVDEDEVSLVRPQALALAYEYRTDVGDHEVYAALGYSRSRQLIGIHPEHLLAVTAGMKTGPLEVTAEYAHSWDYQDESGVRTDSDYLGAKMVVGW